MTVTIAIDAMGGDDAPREIVAGALPAAAELDAKLLLVGDEDAVSAELSAAGPNERIEIVPAADVIGMDEGATDSVKAKPLASLNVGLRLVRKKEASAFVTCGNTGAAMTAALLNLGRIRGISRPALGNVVPTGDGRLTLWLDIGANADNRPIHLIQFAHLGAAFMQRMHEVAEPEVALLSIGEENSKGSELVVEVNRKLRESRLRFIGNLEGKDLPRGVADVVVMDGFTGNVVIKTVEGIAELIFGEVRQAVEANVLNRVAGMVLYPALKKVRRRLDYSEYGGAQLLGVDGICVIGHGRSNARAVASAIRAAHHAAETGLLGQMREVGREIPAKRPGERSSAVGTSTAG